MQLGSITYSSAGAARTVLDGFDLTTSIVDHEIGQKDDFSHALTVANAAVHIGSGVCNGIRAWNEAVSYGGNRQAAPRHGLIAFGDFLAGTGFGLNAAGVNPFGGIAMVVVGSLVSNIAQASTP